ncbi:serine/threonine-protein kinase [Blastococcus deserti]|uniref:non-specific serine/threonine protein kinase n=1 Tax=Blastococcus deserti TaxID=2259033 RepID=A0ABW4X9X0_9ACTN
MTTPGRLVAGRYRLQSQLGGGGMGTVWLARDELLGRQVALKQVLTPPGISAADADQQRQRALREGRIAARLSHPHAISVYDVALENGQPWLVMEYLPSRSLATVLAEDGVLRVDQVAQIGAQVADALAATHAAGIVHRDVKPANILIGEGGRVEGLVKITDFGISHASGDVTLTQTGQITGTPAFLAPEVAQGREMTEASDVFSLGATLYTCIEGAPPFGMEDNALAMLHRVASGHIVPPRRAGSLTEPLLGMLAADPADRPTMPEVRDELAKLAAGRDGDTTTVLLARTDLRSSAPGRERTAALPHGRSTPVAPVPAPPTRTHIPAPVSATAVGPAGPPPAGSAPDASPRELGRRRGRAAWLAAGLAATLLAGLIAFLLLDPMGDDGNGSTAQDSPAASSEPPPSTQPEPSLTQEADSPTAAEEGESGGAGAEATPEGDSVSAQDVNQAVQEFFRRIPRDLEGAYERTSPEFQSRFPYASFAGFWDDFERVDASNVQAEDGSTSAVVDLEYRWPDGTRQTERHLVTYVVSGDGELLLDGDENQGVISSRR